MKKITALILALCCLCALTGCGVQTTGVSQEAYDKVVAERDALAAQLEALKKEPTVTSEHNISDSSKQLIEPVTDKFDASVVLSQLDVTEYSYSNRYSDYAFLVFKNNSGFDIEVSVNIKFYNEAGELIGAKSSAQEAFESETETILYFMPDESFVRMEYELTVSEEERYECVVSNLSYEMTSAKDKEIVSVTNDGIEAAEFVKGYILFFSGDSVVGFDSTYFADNDSELKAGKTITQEMNCFEQYDSVKFYLTGRRY